MLAKALARTASAVDVTSSHSPETSRSHVALPTVGYVRQRELLGSAPVTLEEAERNRVRGKGPRRPRPGSPPIIPFSSPTLWRKVKAGTFPPPVKLSTGTTAWAWQDVRAWMQSRVAAGGVKQHRLPSQVALPPIFAKSVRQ